MLRSGVAPPAPKEEALWFLKFAAFSPLPDLSVGLKVDASAFKPESPPPPLSFVQIGNLSRERPD